MKWKHIFLGFLLAILPVHGMGQEQDRNRPFRPNLGAIDWQEAALKIEAMNPLQVEQFLGQPERIARQILYRRFLEQWTYPEEKGLWIEWQCLKGQEPRVLRVHTPNTP